MSNLSTLMRRRAKGFVAEEEGAVLYFALVILMLMLFVGGMAVDVMRFEAERSRIQAVADAASLAGASMRQTKDPETVVRDWFERADMTANLTGVVVDDSLNYRNVRAETQATSKNYFMRMLGVEQLSAQAAGEAEERRTNVEVAMVLDISGSMEGTKLSRLKTAASEFVTTLLKDDVDNHVSITLVPYNGQVALGPDLITRYNVNERHTKSYCVDLPKSVYDSVGISTSLQMPQHVYADTYNTGATNPDFSTNLWCYTSSTNYVKAQSNNVAELTNQIKSLEAIGATSIDAGLRWGSALIDPSARPAIASMAQGGKVPSYFANRPLDYEDKDSLKAIVLMTDGDHWPNEYVAPGYRHGPSTIYKYYNSSTKSNQWSIYHANAADRNKPYYVLHTKTWQAKAWYGETCVTQNRTTTCTPNTPPSSFEPLTWQEVWQEYSVDYVSKKFFDAAFKKTEGTYLSTLRKRDGTVNSSQGHEVSEMDGRLNRLCTLLKNKNVVIFGIALETTTKGSNIIRNCATPNRFYDVKSADLTTAFRDIRSQISSLRLTQ